MDLAGARIINFNSSTEVEAFVEVPFFDKNAVASQNWFLESGYENAWSDLKDGLYPARSMKEGYISEVVRHCLLLYLVLRFLSF